jgi:photosystem II stability/assembly factor-like uncharacterized protein
MVSRRRLRAGFSTVVLFLVVAGLSSAQVPPSLLQQLHWRSIGPERGGRVTAVAGIPGDRSTYYMGGTGGGVWKTINAGLTWVPVSDRYFKTGSVGSIAVSPSDPNVVYVGMGEACLRSNISHGDGVYKSTDAGRTWQNIGLRDSSQIGRVYVDPKNPDLVYVAAIGHPYGANQERGLFRSTDGGKSWKKILYVDDKTGATDISVDPSNPRTMYVSMWQVLRRPWDIYDSGPGSGIYKTTDGGDTWTQLKNGLPKSDMGKIGLAVSPADPQRIYATIGGDDGGIFRSDDGGANWTLTDGAFEMHSRQYYYGHIFADPQERDTVYTFTSKSFYKSTDAGKTWRTLQAPHGDFHGLWIDPHDHLRMINGNDGGATITFDGGKSWSSIMNQPTAQFYTVRTDNDFPYNVYGAQQDNTTVEISSQGGGASRGAAEHFEEVGGGESGYVVPDPKDPNIVYAGAYWGLLTRYDRQTGVARNITVWPDYPGGRTGSEMKYRFQWTFPIAVNDADPGAIYAGGNVVFKSTNGGQSWTPISPDLTRNDPQKEKGGRLEDVYGTVFTIAPSPINKNVIWAGSDDGLIHLTRDAGKTWNNVTPPAIEPWTRINVIEASPQDPATAYAAVNRYQMDDFKPYIYRTHDFGKSWTLITNGIAPTAFARSVRQDPVNARLLYAATELGVYVSLDDGDHWQSLQQNLPVVPVTDLVIKDGDVVVSTQGRAFWILDDASALEQLTPQVASKAVYLFKPRPAYRVVNRGFGGGGGAPSGVVVDYSLSEAPQQPVTIEFLDAAGKLIKKFSSADAEARPGPQQGRGRFGMQQRAIVTTKPGMNRFVWDMRYPDAQALEGVPTYLFGGSLRGPMVAPGQYTVKISTGAGSFTQGFEIKKDPRVSTTPADYQKQVALLLKVRDRLSEANGAINRIRHVEEQVKTVLAKTNLDPAVGSEARTLNGELDVELHKLYEPRFTGFDDQTLIYPLKLNNRIAAMQGYVEGDYAPTEQATQVFAGLSRELDATLAQLDKSLARVPALNARLKAAGVQPIDDSASSAAGK